MTSSYPSPFTSPAAAQIPKPLPDSPSADQSYATDGPVAEPWNTKTARRPPVRESLYPRTMMSLYPSPFTSPATER